MSGIRYRPSIDGMRAIAVLGVLLFHLDECLLPGGFVGVDVFFVISGYLITSIIYRAAEANHFSISRFYQRRISRIFPVLFAVTLAILVAASWIYSPQDFASAGALAVASVLSVANLKLMLQGDYFDVTADSQPFLHFWSLSVEEQFYIFLPVLLMVAQRFRFSRGVLLSVLWILALSSFAACLYATPLNPTWAFYLLPTRAWELLAGAILAVTATRAGQSSLRAKNALSLIGLSLIVLSMGLINESMPFPGYVALFPVLGSVLLIGVAHEPEQLTERLLSHDWLIRIGRLSYSLYLWHWPIYCFVDYRLFSDTPSVRIGLKVALTVACSVASYFLIEKPFRAYLNQPQRKSLGFIGLAVGVAMLGWAGYTIRQDNYIDSSVREIASGGIQFPGESNSPRIVLMGDSNGSMYGTMMKSLAAEEKLNLNVISVAAGAPFPGTRQYRESLKCLQSYQPDVTVFAAAWATKLDGDQAKLTVALDAILQHSSSIVLITQPPVLPQNATRQYFREHGIEPVYEDAELESRRHRTNEFLATLASDRIAVVRINSEFQRPDGEIVLLNKAGRQLFHDRAHLSEHGAQRVKPQVSAAIRELLKRGSQSEGRQSSNSSDGRGSATDQRRHGQLPQDRASEVRTAGHKILYSYDRSSPPID
ncbi:acyltransferase family protein [Allorhodopirellula solitaria]|uniref:acyltransferase family protein n=1 Tax=Allorhodopirellula solitaria TaxID=2527987 RepID=UPI00164797FA|nr:acyltransferase family protein [Allorhodopirellula solitaria]